MSKKGFVLPSILILLTLVLLIYSQIMVAIPGMVSSLTSTLHGIRAEQSIKNKLFMPISGPPQGIRCIIDSSTRGKITLKQKMCSRFDQVNKLITTYPIHELPCHDQQTPIGRLTIDNKSLSIKSLIAPSLCFNLPNGSSLQDVIMGNIEIHTPIDLHSDSFILGYFNAGVTLTLRNPIRIFSGGDIKLSSLKTLSSTPIDIFLHSRTGEINIGQSHPLIRLHCLAKAHNCTPNYPSIFWAPGQIATKRALYFQ